MTVRNYASYTDTELRRAAYASDEDIDAVLECARRFVQQSELPELPEDKALAEYHDHL
jgi:hypothetical protein